jgi:dipeptidyl aminopeptidase/acylaminoacyl peptidase
LLSAHTLDYSQRGFYRWVEESREQKLVFKQMKLTEILQAARSQGFAFVEESYERAPALVFRSTITGKEIMMAQSNLQQDNYKWGKAQSINYKNSGGEELRGILYYPVDYDSTRSYPMVLHIYQIQSKSLYDYIPPSLENEIGYNVTNLLAQGYFVLLPDIVYAVGKPGKSSTDCVLAAVDRALELANIDPARIALMGQSYGGYQTDFIISQTDRFACAIAGAAVTDLTSSYLDVHEGAGKTNYWRPETQQFRMAKTMFEDLSRYVSNSPVFQAPNVNTPLLSWVGLKDTQVHHLQSIKYYMALRRLGKENIMLVYPHEAHALELQENQEHLTVHIEEWLAHYLKGGNKPSWTVPRG